MVVLKIKPLNVVYDTIYAYIVTTMHDLEMTYVIVGICYRTSVCATMYDLEMTFVIHSRYMLQNFGVYDTVY